LKETVAMADVILVVLRRAETADTLLRAAQRMATLMGGARLSVLGVREPYQVSALAAEALMAEAESVVRARQQEQLRLTALRSAFDKWHQTSGTEARWVEVEGSAPAIIGERGSGADMIVVGQPLEDDRLARQAFSAALFGTDRPVLLVPAGSSAAFGRRVAIAWRDEKNAVKAVIPALRDLAGAEQVHVLMGVRGRAPDPAMPRVLLEHGISAQRHVLPIGSEPFGETLLRKVRELGADMLVMGAYAHSPLRELILGGVTRYVLEHADVPVLMRH
jgi:nucleotide-binding universal stress UspA family protein